MEPYENGGMTHEEVCAYYGERIEAELTRVAALVAAQSMPVGLFDQRSSPSYVYAKGKRPDFDARGRLYDLALQSSPEARKCDLERMAKWLGVAEGWLHGKVAVDIAAGTGFLTKALLQWTRERVYAVDPSRVQLETLLQRCHPYGPVWPILGSPDRKGILSQIPLSTADVVTSYGGLHHIGNLKALFAEVAASLKPGGCFIAGDVGANTPLQRHFDHVVTPKCLTGHHGNWLSPARLAALCQQVGLELAEASMEDVTWSFISEEEMAWFFKALHAYPQPKEEVLQDLHDTLGWSIRNGLIHLNWPMLFFKAVKPLR